MPISTTMTTLATLQETLSITVPVSQSILKAYPRPPARNVSLEPPCFINTWSFPDQAGEDGSFAQGEHRYVITMQMFAEDADLDQGLHIAEMFWEAWLDAWVADQGIKSGGVKTINGAALTGADPTLSLLEWNGKGYPGWTATLDGIIQRV